MLILMKYVNTNIENYLEFILIFNVLLLMFLAWQQISKHFLNLYSQLFFTRMVISIYFSVVAETKFGEQVFVSGNIPALGSWNTARALPLKTNSFIYPQWKNHSPLRIVQQIVLQFKILIKNGSGNIVRWQQIQGNRIVQPIASIIISMQEGKSPITFEKQIQNQQTQVIPREQIKRRGTVDILNDLEDYSESSSGNESSFWKNKMLKSNKKQTLLEQFMMHSHIIIDNLSKQSKTKKKVQCDRGYKLKQKHIYLRKMDEDNMKNLTKSYYNQYRDKDSQKYRQSAQQIKQIIFENLQDLKHELTQKNSSTENFQNKDKKVNIQNNQKPKKLASNSKEILIFHIAVQDSSKDIADFLIKKLSCYVTLYYDTNHFNQQDLVYSPQFIVIKRKNILEDILHYYDSQMWAISLYKQRKIILKKQGQTIIILYENSNSLVEFDDSFRNKRNLPISTISQLVCKTEQIQLPASFRIGKMLEPKFLKNISNKKTMIIINCEKLQDLPQKIINDLISISCKQFIQAIIITGDKLEDIQPKIPLSQKNRMLVVNKQGSIFSHDLKIFTLLDSSIKILNNFRVHVKDIIKILEPWKSVFSLHIQQKLYEIVIKLPNSKVQKIISQQINKQVSSINSFTKYQLNLKKQIIQRQSFIRIKPALFSMDFYARAILSMTQQQKFTPSIFYFQCGQQQNSKQINSIFQNKNIIFNSFCVSEQKNWKSIDYLTMSTFLRTIGYLSSQVIFDAQKQGTHQNAISRSNIVM